MGGEEESGLLLSVFSFIRVEQDLCFFLSDSDETFLLFLFFFFLLLVLQTTRSWERRVDAFVSWLLSSRRDSTSPREPSSFTPSVLPTAVSAPSHSASLFVTSFWEALPSDVLAMVSFVS